MSLAPPIFLGMDDVPTTVSVVMTWFMALLSPHYLHVESQRLGLSPGARLALDLKIVDV